MNCVFFAKWIKFSVKENKTLQKYWKNGNKILAKTGKIVLVQKSGNHERVLWY